MILAGGFKPLEGFTNDGLGRFGKRLEFRAGGFKAFFDGRPSGEAFGMGLLSPQSGARDHEGEDRRSKAKGLSHALCGLPFAWNAEDQ